MILKSCCLETETGRGAHFRRLFAQELSVRKSRNGRHSQLILIGVAMGLPLKTPSRTVKLGFCGIGLKSALYSRVSLEFRRLRFQGLKQAQLIQNAWSQFARDVLHRPQEKSITPKMNQGAALDRLLEWGSLEFALRHAANPILTGTNWPYSINSVFNAGATLLPDGSTLLLCRVEDRRGLSHLWFSRWSNRVHLMT